MRNLLFIGITLVFFNNSLLAGTYSGGSGTSGDPYQIATLGDLKELCQTTADWSAYFIQTGNIDASGTQYWDDADDNINSDLYDDANDGTTTGNNEGFPTIGNSTTKFTGQYDGDNYTISGLTINRSTTDYIGLFGRIETTGNIFDLNLTSVDILGEDHTGALVGENRGTITNCSVNGTVSTQREWVGGFAGSNYGGTISNSNSGCTVTGINLVHEPARYPHNIGGFIGVNWKDGLIDNCYATGDVSTSGHVDYGNTLNTVGGFCGFNGQYESAGEGATITNCYAEGTVTAQGDCVGGFIGTTQPYSVISNCHATGNVTGSVFAGGFIGLTMTQNPTIQTSPYISKCYATGDVTTNAGSYAGGFIGRNQDGSVIEECYATGNASAANNCGAGFAGGNTNSSGSTSIIRNCYSRGSAESGRVMAGGAYNGGFCGWNEGKIEYSFCTGNSTAVQGGTPVGGFCASGTGSEIYTSCFYDDDLSDCTDTDNGEPERTVKMKTSVPFLDAGWSSSIWYQDKGVNDGYPYLSWQNPGGTGLQYPPNPTPYISSNTGGVVEEGGMFTFTDHCLQGADEDGPVYSLSYNVTTVPQHGSLEKSGALMKTDGIELSSFTQNDIANGKISYVHNGDESSEDYFVFYLIDEDNNISEQDTFFITINRKNDQPVITGAPSLTVNEDEHLTIFYNSFYQYVNDPDNADSTLSFTISNTCNNINITYTNTGCNLYGEENWHGTTTLKLEISDGEYTVDTTIALAVLSVNDLPVFTGLTTSYTIQNGDIEIIGLNELAEDIETPDSLLTWNYSATPDSLNIFYDHIEHAVVFGAKGSFEGDVEMEITVTDEDGGSASETITVTVTPDPTGINDLNGVPTNYELSQNYPNPFNPTTVIRYGIPSADANNASLHVTLKIYDILGNLVATLQDGSQSPGYYERTWNAENVSSGIYMYVLQAGSYVESRKMILLK